MSKRRQTFRELEDQVLGLLLTCSPATVERDIEKAHELIAQTRTDEQRRRLEGALEGFAMVRALRDAPSTEGGQR